ncbi:MAG: thiamine phosphate synthase [Anaerovoracaceae bacterium]
MKLDKKDMLLYAVTDRTWEVDGNFYDQVTKALDGGVTLVQLREKKLEESEFVKEAIEIKKICEKYNVPLIINDNYNVAIMSKADGVHVGQSDMKVDELRKIVGDEMIIGVSAQTVEQAICAENGGANYLGVGAVFNTTSKDDADNVTHDTLEAICKAVKIPVVAIGGISLQNMGMLQNRGIDGVSVISAIFAQKDITDATKKLREKIESVVENGV